MSEVLFEAKPQRQGASKVVLRLEEHSDDGSYALVEVTGYNDPNGVHLEIRAGVEGSTQAVGVATIDTSSEKMLQSAVAEAVLQAKQNLAQAHTLVHLYGPKPTWESGSLELVTAWAQKMLKGAGLYRGAIPTEGVKG